ncbi:signal peptidase II [soil metagenome]
MNGAATGHATAPPRSDASKLALFGVTVSAVLVLDIVTKLIVQRTLTPYVPVPVLGDFFRLTYIFNPGAAFGLHLGEYSRWIFLLLSLVATVVLFAMYRTTPAHDRLRLFAIALVTAGAIGNLIDRIRSPRGVIDFLDFDLGFARWPVFNVADIGVSVGALLLAFSLWREDTPASADGDG